MNYNKIGLCCILIISAFLRFYKLDAQSFWIDELFTAYETQLDLSLIEALKASWISKVNAVPPLYFWLMQIWCRSFGLNDLVLRSFSAICGVFSIYALYLLVRQFFERPFALVTASLMAINNYHIYYSQEARPYSLYFLLTIFSFLFLYQYHHSNKVKYILLYVFTTTLMLYTHIYSVFIYAGQLFIVFIWLYPKFRKKSFLPLSLLLPGIFFLPWLRALFIHADAASNQTYGEPVNLYGLASIFTSLLDNQIVWVILALAGLIIIGIKYKSPNNQLFIFCYVSLLFSFLLPFLISVLYKPFFISRYFISLLPVLYICITYVLFKIKLPVLRYSIITVLITASLLQTFVAKDYQLGWIKSDWRSLNQYVMQNNSENCPVLNYGNEYEAYNVCNTYYFDENKYNYHTLTLEQLQADTSIKKIWNICGQFSYCGNVDYIKEGFGIEKEFMTYGGGTAKLYSRK